MQINKPKSCFTKHVNKIGKWLDTLIWGGGGATNNQYLK